MSVAKNPKFVGYRCDGIKYVKKYVKKFTNGNCEFKILIMYFLRKSIVVMIFNLISKTSKRKLTFTFFVLRHGVVVGHVMEHVSSSSNSMDKIEVHVFLILFLNT